VETIVKRFRKAARKIRKEKAMNSWPMGA